jgi:hypothetical protein
MHCTRVLGPGWRGAGIVPRSTARGLGHRGSDAGHGVSAARACALRLDGQYELGLSLARPASRRLHGGGAARNRRAAALQELGICAE